MREIASTSQRLFAMLTPPPGQSARRKGHLSFFIFVLTLYFSTSAAAEPRKLGLAIRLSTNGQQLGKPGEAIVLAALMAARHVNDRVSSLVPDAENLVPAGLNYSLDVRDTEGSPITGARVALEWADVVDVLVGAQRSAVSAPMSLIAALSNTPMISYASTSTTLSDTSSYPTFNRVIPSDGVLASFIVELLRLNRWERFAMLYIDDAYGNSYAQDISSIVGADERQTIVTSQKFKSANQASIDAATRKVAESGARIIVCLGFEIDVVSVLESSKTYGINGRGYVWITGDAVTDPENAVIAAVGKDADELRSSMTGWLRVAAAPLFGPSADAFNTALTSENFEEMLPSLPARTRQHIATDIQAALAACSEKCVYVYDCVWASAIAISQAEQQLGTSLQRGRAEHQELLLSKIRALDFQGASGRVMIDAETGDRSLAGLRLVVSNWVPDSANPDDSTLTSNPLWLYEGEAIVRISDTPPVWPGGASSWTPPLDGTCLPGSVFSEETLQCVPCPRGHELDTAAAKCVPCAVGTIASQNGTALCTSCQEGYADEVGMDKCKSCPDFSRRPASSMGLSVSECQCVPGYYRVTESSACIECPAGAECPGDGAAPFNRGEFWGDSECKEFGGNKDCANWDLFMECNPATNCLANFECAEGRTGRLCLEALDGYFRVGTQWWYECGEYGHTVTVFGIVVVVALWFGIEVVATNRYVAMSVALIFVQIVGMISTFGLKWHSLLHDLNTVLEIANFDVDFVSPFCLTEWSAVRSFYLQLLLPLLMVALYGIFYSCQEVVRCTLGWGVVDYTGAVDERRPTQRIKDNLIQDSIAFVIIVYHTLCIKCFQTFRCERFPDGHDYMIFVPEVKCWTGEHIGMVVSASVYILAVIIGVPVLIAYVVMSKQRAGTLHHPDTNRMWGFLHEPYETGYKYWELMLILRRFLVALLSVVLESSMLQAAITIIVLALLLAAHVFTRPYVSAKIDVLDFCGMCGSIGYVLAGMLLFPSVTKDAQGRICKEGDWSLDQCKDELVVKDSTAVIAMCGIATTILVAFWLTYLYVSEVRSARKASQLIFKGFKADAESDNNLPPINETANQVNLEMILEGSYLLKWTREWKRKVKSVQLSNRDVDQASADGASQSEEMGSNQSISACAISPELQSYLAIDGGVRMLDDDVTQFSNSTLAKILRHLCEIPGILEYLTHHKQDHSLFNFVRKCSQYCDDLEDQFERQGESQHLRIFPEWLGGLKGTPYPITGLVKFEHRPIIAYWLIRCSEEEREHFSSLMHLVMKSNGAPHLRYESGHFSRATSAVPHNNNGNGTLERAQSVRRAQGGDADEGAATAGRRSPAPKGARSAERAGSPAPRGAIGKAGEAGPSDERVQDGETRLEAELVRRTSIEVSSQQPPVATLPQVMAIAAPGSAAEVENLLQPVDQFDGSRASSPNRHSRQSSARSMPPQGVEDRIYGQGGTLSLAMPVAQNLRTCARFILAKDPVLQPGKSLAAPPRPNVDRRETGHRRDDGGNWPDGTRVRTML